MVYSHTLTNTGNGSEGFVLSSGQTVNGAGDQIDLTGFAIYADADGNGVADNATDLTGSTVTLASSQGGIELHINVSRRLTLIGKRDSKLRHAVWRPCCLSFPCAA